MILNQGILMLGIAVLAACNGPGDTAAQDSSLPTLTPTGTATSVAFVVADVPPGIPAYDRDDWRHWTDADGDCQNTRAEVLIDESRAPVGFATASGCRVVSGQWLGLFTGTPVTDASGLDVDHMVPLANAHRSGGWAWDTSTKRAYANDLSYAGHLIGVTASANRSKGSRGPEEWRPLDRGYWCRYATDWAQIKAAWGLSVTQEEFMAIGEMIDLCPPDARLETFGSLGGGLVPPVPTPPGLELYDPFGPDRNCGDFPTWADAQTFYLAAGGPASDPHRLDGDRDGVACESLRGVP